MSKHTDKTHVITFFLRPHSQLSRAVMSNSRSVSELREKEADSNAYYAHPQQVSTTENGKNAHTQLHTQSSDKRRDCEWKLRIIQNDKLAKTDGNIFLHFLYYFSLYVKTNGNIVLHVKAERCDE